MKVTVLNSKNENVKSVVEIRDDDGTLLFTTSDPKIKLKIIDDSELPDLTAEVKQFVIKIVSQWKLKTIPYKAIIAALKSYFKDIGLPQLAHSTDRNLKKALYIAMGDANYGSSHSKIKSKDIQAVKDLINHGVPYSFDLLYFYTLTKQPQGFAYGNAHRRFK